MTSGSGDEVPAQPSLPPEAAQEGDLHLLWEALARKRRMSREPTLDSISELPEEDSRVQHLRQEAEETAPDLSEGYSTADELARTGEADLSHTSSNCAATTVAVHHRCAEGLYPREVGRGWGDWLGP